MMRFAVYTGASAALATGVILSALHQRTNFYSACVYLAQSNACLMILTNIALLSVSMTMLGLQKLLYGPLRPIEVEQLYEKAWFAITETCLAMTTFREEVGGWFLIMFVALLIGKVWGWIGEGRVEVLEQQPPTNPRIFHARLTVSLAISAIFDAFMLWYTIKTVLQHARPNMMVMFAFEFAVLCVTSFSTTGRYAISLCEASITRAQIKLRRAQLKREREQSREAFVPDDSSAIDTASATHPSAHAGDDDLDTIDVDVPGWEEKGRWIFYLDLTTDFLKLILYLTFFCVLCMFYGMPIHIIRDVAITIRSFHKRISDFIRYRHATRNMNARYPDATSEQISREDCCIICREDMKAWPQQRQGVAERDHRHDGSTQTLHLDERLRPKKLPCGHVLHFACLRSWLERQQNCPTCRAPVLVPQQTAVQPQTVPNGAVRGPGQPNTPPVPINGRDAGQARMPAQNVFQFGPFRIAFGARNIMNGAAQGDQAFLNPGVNAGNVPGMQPVPGQTRSAEQAQPRTFASFSPAGPLIQLQHIEQQLVRDITSLRLQADQLLVVRALQAELTRLRMLPSQATGSAPVSSNTNVPRTSVTPSPWRHSTPNGPAFASDPTAPAIGSGHEHLPSGVILPEGWTVLPMERVAGSIDPSATNPNHNSDRRPPSNQSSSQAPARLANGNPFVDIEATASNSNGEASPVDLETGSQNRAAGVPETLHVPQWGSGLPDTERGQVNRDTSTVSGEEVGRKEDALTSDDALPCAGGSSQEKGKGRAATVEESSDSLD
ncbi:uncharacterized protein KY384_008321 [Bacidia gigantensis]|uniref:uncharacterized protein n=1 Tax=Bacidia gigantensis TaxID=2732470 RepID=UPI001D04C010|nr:uncharacterized protein KY384_008321 [Bacidia gigantensis]KAG8526892.1 hypothetical protein KY384_008321 [Bacidia gigantensis]